MSEPEFFQTRMGKTYYDHTLPRIADALETIAKVLTSRDLAKLVPEITQLVRNERLRQKAERLRGDE